MKKVFCTLHFDLNSKQLSFFYYLATFKEICPGGMGYTVLPNPPVNKPVIVYQEPTDLLTPQPLPTPERPVEAFGKADIIPGESQTCYTQEMFFLVSIIF